MHANSTDEPKAPGGAQSPLAKKFYDALMALQYAPVETLTTFQENVLEDLVETVAAQNEFHRKRLAPVIDANGKADLAHWHKVPILTQADVVAHSEALRATAIPKEHGRIFRYQTSGTTGSSLAYYRSELADLAVTCCQHRHISAMGFDWSKDLALIRAFDPALLRFRQKQKAPPQRETWGPGWLPREGLGAIHRLSVFTALDAQLDWLNSLGSVYLNTFPSNALALARHVRKTGRAKPQLLAILTAGEPVTQDVRREVEARLGCPCRDLVSNAEGGIIACECPAGQGYHLQMELARIELLDQRNRPVRAGQWGRVVITPLYNFATPLIRFDTGDLARLKGDCVCGRRHPLIELVYGRPSNLLRDGKSAWMRPDLASEEIERHLPDSRWQVVQTSARTAELRYMRLPGGKGVDAVAAAHHVRSALGGGIAVTAPEVAALGPGAGGKFLAFVNQSVRRSDE